MREPLQTENRLTKNPMVVGGWLLLLVISEMALGGWERGYLTFYDVG
jgi:hypothetical protein